MVRPPSIKPVVVLLLLTAVGGFFVEYASSWKVKPRAPAKLDDGKPACWSADNSNLCTVKAGKVSKNPCTISALPEGVIKA